MHIYIYTNINIEIYIYIYIYVYMARIPLFRYCTSQLSHATSQHFSPIPFRLIHLVWPAGVYRRTPNLEKLPTYELDSLDEVHVMPSPSKTIAGFTTSQSHSQSISQPDGQTDRLYRTAHIPQCEYTYIHIYIYIYIYIYVCSST